MKKLFPFKQSDIFKPWTCNCSNQPTNKYMLLRIQLRIPISNLSKKKTSTEILSPKFLRPAKKGGIWRYVDALVSECWQFSLMQENFVLQDSLIQALLSVPHRHRGCYLSHLSVLYMLKFLTEIVVCSEDSSCGLLLGRILSVVCHFFQEVIHVFLFSWIESATSSHNIIKLAYIFA